MASIKPNHKPRRVPPLSEEPTETDIITTPDASAELLANSFGDYVQIVGRRIRSGESGALPVTARRQPPGNSPARRRV